MAVYQVAIISRPRDWEPECLDDVPLELGGPVEVLDESDDLMSAVGRAIEHNGDTRAEEQGRWAVVIEPGTLGRIWPAARLCTPLTYKVTAIWWPEGWEPASPLDVPHCVWHTQGRVGEQWLTHEQAVGTAMALNRQCMDQPGTTWYVVVAIEHEAISQTVSYDPAGIETTVEVRRLHVLRPEEGGRGDCSYCPAHTFPCAQAEWDSQLRTVTTKRSRSLGDEEEE